MAVDPNTFLVQFGTRLISLHANERVEIGAGSGRSETIETAAPELNLVWYSAVL